MTLYSLKLHRDLQRVADEGIDHVNSLHTVHKDTRNVMIGAVIVAMYAWVEENAKPNEYFHALFSLLEPVNSAGSFFLGLSGSVHTISANCCYPLPGSLSVTKPTPFPQFRWIWGVTKLPAYFLRRSALQLIFY